MEINNAFETFKKDAINIHPSYRDPKWVKDVMASFGRDSFNVLYQKSEKKELEEFAAFWTKFVSNVIAFNPDVYLAEHVVKFALYDMKARIGVDNEPEMMKACIDYVERRKSRNGWDLICPICGSKTKRNPKMDFFFKSHDKDLGWTCLGEQDPDKPSHFMQASTAGTFSQLQNRNVIVYGIDWKENRDEWKSDQRICMESTLQSENDPEVWS